MPQPGNGLDKTAGFFIMLAAIELVSYVLLAQHLYPGYSLNNNYISDLGVGSTSTIFNPAIIVFGLLLASGSYFMWKAGKHRLAALGFLIIGLGGMGVGTFPETTGWPHILSALVTFGAVGVTAAGFSLILKSRLRYYSLAAGIFALLILFIFSSGLIGIKLNFGLGKGGIEEILFYDELIWAFIIGISFIKGRI
ncbi:MAG TPA: DUF998 domain-containing protein [Candidatus Saccharimonadales bacterium]|nr:DUF998 domain-containing protein [Candidatus Saccharimonadales bacterium]